MKECNGRGRLDGRERDGHLVFRRHAGRHEEGQLVLGQRGEKRGVVEFARRHLDRGNTRGEHRVEALEVEGRAEEVKVERTGVLGELLPRLGRDRELAQKFVL